MKPALLFVAGMLAAIALAASCRSAQAPVKPDASDAASAPDGGDPASLACGRLKLWGCPIGDDPHCADVYRLPSRFGKVDPECVLLASSPGAAERACGVTCSSDAGGQ